ncbi:glycosyltransferase family 2 protein [Flavobacterium sp.]
MMQLVSVPVVTYNAATFVVETLESIFHQSHQNIQLIVSDDCSIDNTVELVEKWCTQPKVKDRFSDIKIITVPKNTGVSANCNRCIKASDAEWIKFIAGDDILLPNCIEDNLKFVAENQEAKIVFSQVKVYQDDFEQSHFVKALPKHYPDNLMKTSFTADDQFKILLESDRINYTPSYFFNKKTIVAIGGYDEANTLVEDYPMWLKLTKAGIQLFYFHTATVGYRIHSKATNNTGEDLLFKPSVINSYSVRKKFVHPYLSKNKINQERWSFTVTKMFLKLGVVKKTSATEILYKFLTIYTNPFVYINHFSK